MELCSRLRLLAPLVGLAVVVALAGCSAAQPVAPAPDVSDVAPVDPVPEAGSDDGVDASPTSCATLDLDEPDAEIESSAIAICILDHFSAAGSGAYAMRSANSSVDAVWRVDSSFEVSAELDSGARIVMLPDVAWVDLDGSGWVRADALADDPAQQVAGLIVETAREQTPPGAMQLIVEAAPVWRVGAATDVELPDGASERLVPVETGAFALSGVDIERMRFLLAPSGRLVLQETTASIPGIPSTPATVHYTGWGDPVEFPAVPEDDRG